MLNQRKNRIKTRLKDIVTNLREVSDIEGAMLVEGSNSVLACDLPDSTDYEKEIPKILALLEQSDIPVRDEKRDTMFAHQVLDYNGFKILAKKLKDRLTLLVMLQKRGYESLAMLDIENSIRKIYEIRGIGG